MDPFHSDAVADGRIDSVAVIVGVLADIVEEAPLRSGTEKGAAGGTEGEATATRGAGAVEVIGEHLVLGIEDAAAGQFVDGERAGVGPVHRGADADAVEVTRHRMKVQPAKNDILIRR